MSLKNHPYLKGIVLSILGFSLFACGDAIIKYLAQFYPLYTVVFWDVLATSLVFVLASPWLGGFRRTVRSPNVKWHLLRGVISFLQIVTIIYGFNHMSLSKAYALVFCAPFITVLLARLVFGEAIGLKKWMILILGFTGVLVILRPGLIPLDLASLAVLASAFGFSCSSLMAKHFGKGDETLLSLSLLPNIACLLCVLPFFLGAPEMLSLPHFGLLAGLSIMGSIAFLSSSLSFVVAPAATVAPFHYIQILWGIGLGYLFFGDGIDLFVALGAAIVIACGLWLLRQKADDRVLADPGTPVAHG